MKLSRITLLFVSVSSFLLVPTAGAQTTGDKLAASTAENVKLLRQYTWKQRVVVKYKGEEKFVRVKQVKLDPDGKKQENVLSEKTEKPPSGPIRRAIAEHKRVEMKDYVDNHLYAFIESYLPLKPERLKAALPTAQVGAVGNAMGLTMKNYQQQGDSLTIGFDSATRKLLRLELDTKLENDPITVIVEMGAVPNGPTYPSVTKIKVPAKDIEVDVSEYDFMKL
jgi:hypothetical protein